MKGRCVVVYFLSGLKANGLVNSSEGWVCCCIFPVRPEGKWSCHLQGEDEGEDGTMVKKVDEPDGTMKAQAEGQQTFHCSNHPSLFPTPR